MSSKICRGDGLSSPDERSENNDSLIGMWNEISDICDIRRIGRGQAVAHTSV
ncbi:MAG TPA: hypothetical protein VNB22_16690 [Pyrinomonadaceae bacterium]|nr:hypothetical protein [Pyrinomonadaceae bacterium]